MPKKIYKKLTKIVTVCERNSAGASSLKKESLIDPIALEKSLNHVCALALVHCVDYSVAPALDPVIAYAHRVSLRRPISLLIPPVFSDRASDIKFRSWRTAMEGKLQANRDHFPTVKLHKTYVASRLDSAIYNQVVLGLSIFDDDNNNNNPSFDNKDNILDYLKNIYKDPVR
ncbi:hypothetical protein N7481_008610 [Penicillium waksmanii]|uniref:uncharacterized protein n=1 Tax=Penicillium waksmanii TaxID=69791 RepID=UPI002548D22D|nr:uncharacterized protein N7481_008610 [Penicillium waksmanii]KAJ5974903.1 hypothetical protein N7481_008610 [Penicillium waksmanii]